MSPKIKLLIAIPLIAVAAFLLIISFKNQKIDKSQLPNELGVLAPSVYQKLTDSEINITNGFEEDITISAEKLFKNKRTLTWLDLIESDNRNKKSELNNISNEYKVYILEKWNLAKVETNSDFTKVEEYFGNKYQIELDKNASQVK